MSHARKTFSDIVEIDSSESVVRVESFDAMMMKDAIVDGLYAYGIDSPSTVQQLAAVQMINGKDVILQAPPGSGKTVCCAIAILQTVETSGNEPSTQALYLTSNRKTAVQGQKTILSIGERFEPRCYTCIGGSNLNEDIRQVITGQQIICGTPSRILDMIKRNSLHTNHVRLLVLDETDEMLATGFKEQILELYRTLPPRVQVVLATATFPIEILNLAAQLMTRSIRFHAREEQEMRRLECVRQFLVPVDREAWKFDTLCDLFDALGAAQAVVFCNGPDKVEKLVERMREINFPVAAMHGEMSLRARDAVLEEFRAGRARWLLTTDVWVRGVDVHLAPIVINYDLPENLELYVQRMGPSRFKAKGGVVINLMKASEIGVLREIEKHYSIKIDEMPIDITSLLL